MSLVDFARGYDTDKGTAHRYFELYATILHRHRTTATRVLEFGVLRGGSLALWRDWFTTAEVHGVDPVGVDVVGATVHRMDAYTGDAISALPGPWDVIIDDGPHTVESQMFTAAHWSQLLTRAGTLVIEDIVTDDYAEQIVEALPSRLRRFASIVDRRLVPGVTYGDDLLVVVDLAAA